MKKDLDEATTTDQIRVDFVANVSHELRTPLTAIKGYAETLLSDIESGLAPNKDFLYTILRNTKRLMDIMEDLLELSSLEATKTILPREKLDVRTTTQTVLEHTAHLFQQKKQIVKVDYETNSILANAKKLEQVLVNLLDNAHKYTPEGSHVHIQWFEDNDFTVLTVTDTGPGIPQDHLGRIFERFYRVDKGRSRSSGGTGLGLAIVKHILQRHGGIVAVESVIGKGTTFVCRFPTKE